MTEKTSHVFLRVTFQLGFIENLTVSLFTEISQTGSFSVDSNQFVRRNGIGTRTAGIRIPIIL